MKCLFILSILFSSTLTFAASETISQCAVNNVNASSGARINLLLTEKGEYKANFIIGTTVSGTAYQLKQISPGVFVGSIKNKPQYPMKLTISTVGAANLYISGYESSLSVVYPNLNSASKQSSLKTVIADKFVCGKKVSNF